MTASLRAAADGSKAILKVNGIDRLYIHEDGMLEALASPAQFANNKQLATTEAVRDALGSMAGQLNIDASGSIPESAAGKRILVSTAGIALTLPPISSVAVGSRIYIRNNTAALGRQALSQLTIHCLVNRLRRARFLLALLFLLPALLCGILKKVTPRSNTRPCSVLRWLQAATVAATGPTLVSRPVVSPNAVFAEFVSDITAAGTAILSGVVAPSSTTSQIALTGNGSAAPGQVYWLSIGY